MSRELSELTVGERWAYRKKGTDPVTCVEVVRLGTGRPSRVQVKFIDDEFEGREEWAPPARLKVLWSGVDAWRESEDRWSRLREASECALDSPEENALLMVFEYLPDWNLLNVHYRDDGIGRVSDLEALLVDLGLDRELIIGDPVSFREDDIWFVPRRVTQVIVERLTRKYADTVIKEVEAAEQEAQKERQRGSQSINYYFSPESCAKVDEQYAPARAQIRQWCGAEAKDRYDELVALRGEAVRLGKLVERAINAVRSAGNVGEADVLERELGIPLEMIRKVPESDQVP
ncbi:MAG: hypothetical protein GEV28_16960 [Actinophytocola sp.]|uniref:hypothetical protein n=1 Tax=Actinophytocola sp. TaxID=1872138 RepID=UPI001323ACB9|nr:hypothetical protein [Actinophytocola sp.]MPZ81983.1 hypothetical protein [Actinophytocola sp.]